MLALLFVAALATQAPDATKLWQGIDGRVGPHVVRIEIASGGETVGYCSGVIIAPDFVLTAAHCVPMKVEGRSLAVDKRHAEVMRCNYALDLAILRALGLKGAPIERMATTAWIGMPVTEVGYFGGEPSPAYRFGHVGRLEPTEYAAGGVLSDVHTLHGDSGAPLFDHTGAFITIVHMYDPDGGTLSIAVQPEVVRQFCDPFWPKAEKK